MAGTFYPIPFPCMEIMQQRPVSRITLEESIEQHIRLIITTACTEIRDSYGCDWWKDEFDISIEKYCLIMRIEYSIKMAIRQYEKRVEVDRMITDIREEQSTINSQFVKKRIYIYIAGHIVETRQPFQCNISFFISPLS